MENSELNLTIKDIELIKDGLSKLIIKPASGFEEKIVIDSVIDKLLDGAPEAMKNQIRTEWDEKRKTEMISNKMIEEDVVILQGKLMLMKRNLEQDNFLNDVKQVLRNDEDTNKQS